MTLEVSFAQTCQLPATTAANPEFEGGEGVITKRCFVLLSVRDDDGATTEVVIDWTQSGNCDSFSLRNLHSHPRIQPRSKKNAIQNLGNYSEENQEALLRTSPQPNFHCCSTLFRFLEDMQALSLNAASIQYRSDNMVIGNIFK